MGPRKEDRLPGATESATGVANPGRIMPCRGGEGPELVGSSTEGVAPKRASPDTKAGDPSWLGPCDSKENAICERSSTDTAEPGWRRDLVGTEEPDLTRSSTGVALPSWQWLLIDAEEPRRTKSHAKGARPS